VRDVPGTSQRRPDLDLVIVAIGARPSVVPKGVPGVFVAGDVEHGPTTVVEAVAAGKNAALAVLASLAGEGGQGTGNGLDTSGAVGDRGGAQPASSPVRV